MACYGHKAAKFEQPTVTSHMFSLKSVWKKIVQYPLANSTLDISTTLANSTFWLATEFVELSRGYCITFIL